jgi:peptide chain release factor 2
LALKRCGGIFDVSSRKEQLAVLEEKAADPTFWNDQDEARKTIDRTNNLKAVIEPFEAVVALMEDLEVMFELSELEEDEAEKAVADELVEESLKEILSTYQQLELQSLLGDEIDTCNAYININAGAGGTESCDWAGILYRMFLRYAERKKFKYTLLDLQDGEEAGIKSVSIYIEGPYAYGMLRSERGVHRLVRISPFDANSRRHTSFAAVEVTAELNENIVVEVNKSDIREDTYRASGAGGQHVNKTDSAIRLTHIPTGVVVQCQAERSQHNNRARALKMLESRIYEMELEKQRSEREKLYGDKGAIAWGSQIRSYVMQPYTMVKDHRTSTDVGNINGVLDGDLDVFVEKYLKYQRKQHEEHSG